MIVFRSWRCLALSAALALLPASAQGESPPFNPIGHQDVLVIPLQFTPTGKEKPEDCVPPPPEKPKDPTDAAATAQYEAAMAQYKSSLTVWKGYLEHDFVGVRKSAAEWGEFLNSKINAYYTSATDGQTSFRFEVLRDKSTGNGWWPSPRPLATYCAEWKAGHDAFGEVSVVRDAIEKLMASAAKKNPGLYAYHRVLVLQNLKAHGGVSTFRDFTLAPKKPATFSFSWIDEETDDHDSWMTYSHELGHQLGLTDYYGSCGSDPSTYDACTGHWDIMGPWGAQQFNAYSRLATGWLIPIKKIGVGSGGGPGMVQTTPELLGDASAFTASYHLAPLEGRGGPGVPRALRIPLLPWTAGSAQGYLAECRRKAHDPEIPAEGLVLHEVNEPAPFPNRAPIRTLRPFDPGDPDRPLANSGETYTFTVGGDVSPRTVSIRFDGFSADGGCDLTLTRGKAAKEIETYYIPELKFKRFLPPAAKLWIGDSLGPQAIQPGRTTEIHVAVRNAGRLPAHDVRVHVTAASALTLPGCRASSDGFAGTITIPFIAAGGEAVGSVDWTPRENSAVQLRAVIEGQTLQPAVTSTAMVLESTGSRVSTSFAIDVPNDCGISVVHPVLLGASAGWHVTLTPIGTSRERRRFRVDATPSGRVRPGERAQLTLAWELSRGTSRFNDALSLQSTVQAARLTVQRTIESNLKSACPPSGDTGQPFGVTGSLRPRTGSVPVRIDGIAPDGHHVVARASTDSRGHFSVALTPNQPGRWMVLAATNRAGRVGGAGASPCVVDVSVAPPTPATPTPVPSVPTPTPVAVPGTPNLVVNALTGSSVTIRNAGDGTAGAFAVTVLDPNRSASTLQFGELAPGASETRTFPCLTGRRDAIVDPDQRVAEAREDDNTASLTVVRC